MSKGGVYTMNEKGERVLVEPPTRGLDHPEHRNNKPVAAEPKKKKPAKAKPSAGKADPAESKIL